MAKQARYQVMQPVFVNGSLFDPASAKNGQPIFVMADEGLEGPALKLVVEKAPAKPRAPKPPPQADAGAGDAGDGGTDGPAAGGDAAGADPGAYPVS